MAVRILGLKETTKIYQASTSELFGKVQEKPKKKQPILPKKSYELQNFMHIGYINIENPGLFACNGIFNHESPRRGETFVTRKITRGLSRIECGLENCLYLGNLDSLRDWGHARDYVEMQWLMLQQEEPRDYVISTGRQETIREFVEITAKKLGWTNNSNNSIIWSGEGVNEVGRRADTNEIVVRVDPRYFRPNEVDSLLGDSSHAKDLLGWEPKTSLEELIDEMIKNDMNECKKEIALKI